MATPKEDKKAEKKRLAEEKKAQKVLQEAEKKAAKEVAKLQKEAAKAAKKMGKAPATNGGHEGPAQSPLSPATPLPAEMTLRTASPVQAVPALEGPTSAPEESAPEPAPATVPSPQQTPILLKTASATSESAQADPQTPVTPVETATPSATAVSQGQAAVQLSPTKGSGSSPPKEPAKKMNDAVATISSSQPSRRSPSHQSFHGAPTVQTPGVTALTEALPSSLPSSDMMEHEVVEDEADEQVGAMTSSDASVTADYLANVAQSLKATMKELYNKGTNKGYSRRYQQMNRVGTEQICTHSYFENNKLKNRYGNIAAYDHSRVVLPIINDDPDTDYVNANYVDGYKRKAAYIASQGPVPNSFISFWRMVWHTRIETIVMVTHEVEQGKMKCHRYWPDPTSSPPVIKQQYGSIVVTHLKSEAHKHFVMRSFEVTLNGETRQLKQFAYTSWPDHGVPLTTGELLGFRNAVRHSTPNRNVPLLIHCSAGVGRTGTYIAIDRLVEQCLDMGGELDVDAIVRDMRMARNYMVQTEVQYMFIYRAVLDAIGDLLANESKKAIHLETEQAEHAARQAAADAAAAEKAAADAIEREHIERARIELLARHETSASSAALIVEASKLSVKDRLKILKSQKDKWLENYRKSLEEWNQRYQFEAEIYDLTSTLTPIQSRMEALRQKGMLLN